MSQSLKLFYHDPLKVAPDPVEDIVIRILREDDDIEYSIRESFSDSEDKRNSDIDEIIVRGFENGRLEVLAMKDNEEISRVLVSPHGYHSIRIIRKIQIEKEQKPVAS